jgi:signal peptidase I
LEGPRKAWNFVKSLDPAEYVKRKYNLKGTSGGVIDLVFGFVFAVLLYFVLMPAILGANPPAVVVMSCSMRGTLNVGDIVVLQGVSPEDVRAPEAILESPEMDVMSFRNSRGKETLYIPNGNPSEVNVDMTGDTLVYVSKITGIQIIHRVIAKLKAPDGHYYYITKGDANFAPDALNQSSACDIWAFGGGGSSICAEYTYQGVCTSPGDVGCLATPVRDDELIGRQILNIPLVGHVKLIPMHILHILTGGLIGPGYVGEVWC